MNPQTRNLLIQRVIDSLASLAPGPIFERFAVVLVENLRDVTLAQRGSAVNGSPVGGALDAVSPDGRIVVEASIEKSYFTGAMKKPWGDLDHTLLLAPAAEHIYLLSSQRAETGVIEEMVNTACQQERMQGRSLHLMDSRSIAEAIVDTLMLRDDAIDDLAKHLHVLGEIRDDHPASLIAPQLSAFYVPNEAVDEEIDRRLGTSACVEIVGMGGIGKSQAAAACLRRSEERFHYRFWVSGRDIDSVERLSSVPVRRGGAERNVTALLRRDKTLLVIDDAKAGLEVEHLSALCGPDSRILITRQHTSAGAFAMPPMDKDHAFVLLGRGLSAPPPSDEFQKIWEAVGGHPLSLSMLNTAAIEGVPWHELADDCVHVAKMPAGGVPLADRILGRLRPVMEEQLCLFQWAGHSHCDRAFFRYVVGTVRLNAFERHGLTAPESEASIRIHDIVFAALQSLNWLTAQKEREINDRLETFIRQQIREDGHGLQLIASQLRNKIIKNVEMGDRRPAFLYALTMVWTGSAIPINLLPDALQEAQRLKPLSAVDNDISILVVLETIEAKGRYLKQQFGDAAAIAYLSSVLSAYDDLEAIRDVSPRQAAEIKHHRAKTFRAINRSEEAERLFGEVVAAYPLNDAKLQLVRTIGIRPADYEAAKQYSFDIINDKLSNKDVSPSLLMALGDTLNLARKTWAGDLMGQHEELFLSEALYSAAIGIPQGYHSVANFIRALVWFAPHQVKGVLQRLPEPSAWMLDDDQSRGAYAEIMLLASGIEEETERLMRALDAFEALKTPNPYQKRKWGETLYKLDRHAEAETILEAIVDSSGRLWCAHSLSQVKLALGKLGEALTLVDESVEGAVGQHERYRASFFLQRAKVRIALGQDPSADIEQGRSFTDNPGLLEQFAALTQSHVADGATKPTVEPQD